MAQYIDGKACIACGECWRRCPVGAITAGTSRFAILAERCIDCGICGETCPEGAVRPGEEVRPVPAPRRTYRVLEEACIGCSLCARACPAGLNKWTREDTWKPHTSLLYVPGADLSPVAEAMRQAFEPFVTQVDRIEFSRVYENQGRFSYETAETILLE